MTTIQMQSKQNFTKNYSSELKQKLRRQLEMFGLNPQDWEVQGLRENQQKFRIAQKCNSAYEFIGEIDEGLRWKALELIPRFSI